MYCWQDCEVEEAGLFSGCVRKSDAEQQSEFPRERLGLLSCFMFIEIICVLHSFLATCFVS